MYLKISLWGTLTRPSVQAEQRLSVEETLCFNINLARENPLSEINLLLTTPTLVIAVLCSVQFSHSVMSDSVIPWTSAHQASLSITNSWSQKTHVHWVSDAIQPSHPLSSWSLENSVKKLMAHLIRSYIVWDINLKYCKIAMLCLTESLLSDTKTQP